MGPASFSFFVLARGYLQSPQEMFKQISMLFLKNDQVQYSNLETWLLTMVSLTYSHPNNQLNPAMWTGKLAWMNSTYKGREDSVI